MQQAVIYKICTAIIFMVGVILSWGRIIYATNDLEHFQVIGAIISLIGYDIFFWAVLRYENTSENQN